MWNFRVVCEAPLVSYGMGLVHDGDGDDNEEGDNGDDDTDDDDKDESDV